MFKLDTEYELESAHEDRHEGQDDDDDEDDNALVGGRVGESASGEPLQPAFFWESVIEVDGVDRKVVASNLVTNVTGDASEDPNGQVKWISFTYDGAASQASNIYWDPTLTGYYVEAASVPADTTTEGDIVADGSAAVSVMAAFVAVVLAMMA